MTPIGGSVSSSIATFYYYKYKEKFVILQLIGIVVIKSKETRVVTTPTDILVGI